MATYFPIRVKYADRPAPEIVDRPEDIRSGVSFRVLELNVTPDDSERNQSHGETG